MVTRAEGPHPAGLSGARITLVGEHDNWLDAIQAYLLQQGAIVERIPFAALDRPGAQLGEAVVVHLVGPATSERSHETRRERAQIAELARQHRVIGLLDDPAIDVAPALLDFVLPPFEPAEVAARLQRALVEPHAGLVRCLGNLEVSVGNRTVAVGGRTAEVTFQEFELLRALIVANGRVLTRDDLARELGHPSPGAASRRVDIHVHRLRAKLPDLAGARIETVRNVGYRLAASPR